jgi:hypothetical protein
MYLTGWTEERPRTSRRKSLSAASSRSVKPGPIGPTARLLTTCLDGIFKAILTIASQPLVSASPLPLAVACSSVRTDGRPNETRALAMGMTLCSYTANSSHHGACLLQLPRTVSIEFVAVDLCERNCIIPYLVSRPQVREFKQSLEWNAVSVISTPCSQNLAVDIDRLRGPDQSNQSDHILAHRPQFFVISSECASSIRIWTHVPWFQAFFWSNLRLSRVTTILPIWESVHVLFPSRR